MRCQRVLATGVLTVVCLLDTAPASASDNVLAPSCSGIVEGQPGQQVLLDPRSVADPILTALAPQDPFNVLTGPLRQALSTMGPIPVGTIPDGQTEITGQQIADAVNARVSGIPLVAPALMPAVNSAIDPLCGLLVRGTRPGAPPTSKSPGAPGAPGAPGGSGAPSPGERSGQPGTAVAEGSGAVFGEPLSGLLVPGAAFALRTNEFPGDAPPVGGPGTERAALVNPASSAGSADSLPGRERQLVSVPILLAILLATIVGAQLARRWALHKRR